MSPKETSPKPTKIQVPEEDCSNRNAQKEEEAENSARNDGF
jgi:hypothetical protein